MENNICIYCGSSAGHNAQYAAAARRLGHSLAHHGFGLVYGGGRVGLMGILADAVLAGGGRAVGVIPEPLASQEIAHEGLSELIVVHDMHERKALMAGRARAFLTLPGGVGTLEEFFETLSWATLGLHRKPVGILNVAGYFNPLLALLDHGVSEGFIRPQNLDLLVVSVEPDTIVPDLLSHRLPSSPRQPIDFQ
jgi:uncharacterized protein (TIGR00730 family)